MNRDKKCTYCARYYQGEGFEKACTSHCHYAHIYKQTHETNWKKTKAKPKEPKPSSDLTSKQREELRIKNLNEKWLNRKADDTPKSQYKRKQTLERQELYGSMSSAWLKKYNGVRG